MLNFDEVDRILVTNPFTDDSAPTAPSSNGGHTLASLTFDDSTQHHPLCSQSVSAAPRCHTPSIQSDTAVGSEGETQPKLAGLSGSAEDHTATSVNEAPRGGGSNVIHPVGPNDSFAGVALRYGVSIAALRRANQLWPSDPIHFRTELLIPRGGTLQVRTRHRPIHNLSKNAGLRSTVEPTPDLFLDPVASSFVAARSVILSMLPARISLDSLSSKASVSEDHELDNLQAVRAHKITGNEAPFSRDGYELSVMAAPLTQHKLSSQTSRSLANDHHIVPNHISPVGDIRSRSTSSSPRIALQRPSRKQPFAVLPVCTSQLEPEPAMELPARRSRI